MVIYLDMCCLKRPFDDQSQPRIRLEGESVLALMAIEGSDVGFTRSTALLLENAQNPIRERAVRVEQWLKAKPLSEFDDRELEKRTRELMQLGFKNFDAIHLSSAELARADALATCDDRLLAAARRNSGGLRTRVVSIIELAQEVLR